MHDPRDYQMQLENDIYGAWHSGARNVLAVLPTGGGKTFVLARVAVAMKTATCAIAHRSELVSQISLALAREGVRHKIVGPEVVRRACVTHHMDEFGRSFYDPSSRIAVAGVDTLINHKADDPWLAQVGLWIQDEAHHVLADNKWGTAADLFPNARGLGFTATPVRADGKGLGRHADGLMDAMVQGPAMRALIKQRHLTDYRVFAPPSDIDLSRVTTTGSGDFSPPKLKEARRASHITGDVVQHYLRIARGKLGVTFDTDIESATETAAAYRAAGVAAEVVTSKTPPLLRAMILRQFRNRELQQLVNVDLFGEGFDLPAIEVVSMARPTQSYGLYCQQFGRALRPLAGKNHAIIIDHVGNVERHGLPDARKEWTLDRRERRSRSAPSDVIPVRTCPAPTCLQVYERIYSACPYCGFEPPVADRSAPERVDGDLQELDPAVLAKLRGEIARVDAAAVYPYGAGEGIKIAVRNNHAGRQIAQGPLRASLALWGGWQTAQGRSIREGHRRFYFRFGVDVATACTLGASEAVELAERVNADLAKHNVREHGVV